MKYYILNRSLDLKEIGTYLQSQGMQKGIIYNSSMDYSINKVRPFTKPGEKVRIPSYDLDRKAKPTDLLSQVNDSYTRFFVSPRMEELMNEFRIPLYEPYKAEFHVRGGETHIYRMIRYYSLPLMIIWRNWIIYPKALAIVLKR